MKILKGDNVMITVGKDKGKQAKVERVYRKEDKILLPGLNQYKKHRKPQGEGKPGEILTISNPILASKVSLVCPKCKLVTRVGLKMINDKKVRFCRKCDQVI